MLGGGGNIQGRSHFQEGVATPPVHSNLPSPRQIAIVRCENRARLGDGASALSPAGAIGRGTKEGCRKEMLHNLLKTWAQQKKCF